MVLNPAHQHGGRPAGDEADPGTSQNLAQQGQQHHAVPELHGVALGHAQREQEQHHAGAVVEQALADDRRAQARRQRQFLQKMLDHDRVGRRQDGAEDETPGERHGQADRREGQPHPGAEDRGGEDHACRRQQ